MLPPVIKGLINVFAKVYLHLSVFSHMKDPVSLKYKLACMGREVIGIKIIKMQIYLLIKQNISSLLEIELFVHNPLA